MQPNAVFVAAHVGGAALAIRDDLVFFLERLGGLTEGLLSLDHQISRGKVGAECRLLLIYAESHQEHLSQEHLGIPSARVLALTTSHARMEAMRRAVFELVVQPLAVPQALFLFGIHLPCCADPLTAEIRTSDGTRTRLLP